MSMSTYQVHWTTRRHGRLELRDGVEPSPPVDRAPPPPTPSRIARLVALSQRIEALVRGGAFSDYAQLAVAAGLTRARVSQITDLALLAPDIQEELLEMTREPTGRERIGERHLRGLVREPDWAKQRRIFAELKKTKFETGPGRGDQLRRGR